MTRSPPQSNALLSGVRLSLKFSPVFLGSAVKSTAVQPLLDGVCSYLVSSERQVVAHDTAQTAGSPQAELVPASARLLVDSALKSRTTDVYGGVSRVPEERPVYLPRTIRQAN